MGWISNLASYRSKIRSNTFLFLLLGVIVLAWLYPPIGISEGVLHLPKIAGYGVSLIFFFYGAKLSTEQLLHGVSKWRLHVAVQLATFLLFPLIILLARQLFPEYLSSNLGIGIFFLATLPSTVSSSVVMVSLAKGDLASAIFNASISSIIGIVVTPVWMSLIMVKSQPDFELAHTIGILCLQVLAPLILGLLAHKKLYRWTIKNKNNLQHFDQLVILLIIYTSFCESFSNDQFSNFAVAELLKLGVLMLLFFLSVFFLMNQLAIMFGFKREERITLIFCGSKKSLVQGAVMGKVLFPNQAILGVVLLPLMIYHALQLLIGSTIAKNMGTKREKIQV
jgi:sodium/bile acid cotransporter 7